MKRPKPDKSQFPAVEARNLEKEAERLVEKVKETLKEVDKPKP